MGRARDGKVAAKAKKYGKGGSGGGGGGGGQGKKKGKRGRGGELEWEATKKRSRKQEQLPAEAQPSATQMALKMKSSQLQSVDDFFDAVEKGVEITGADNGGDGGQPEEEDGTGSAASDSEEEEEEDDDLGGGDEEAEEDSDSDSEEEEEDDENADDLRLQIARHKQQLRSLKKADPEFYKFMQEEGEEELGFGADVDTADLETRDLQAEEEDDDEEEDDNDEDEEDEEGGEDDDDEDEEGEREKGTVRATAAMRAEQRSELAISRAQAGKKLLDMATLERWISDATRTATRGGVDDAASDDDESSNDDDDDDDDGKASGARRKAAQLKQKRQLGAVQLLLRAFDAAAVLLGDPSHGSAGAQGGGGGGSKRRGGQAAAAQAATSSSEKAAVTAVRRCRYKIESGAVFDSLLVCVTREMPTILLDDVLGRPPAQLAEDGTASRELQGWRPQRSPRWSELVKPIGRYCQNLLKLLQSVTEAEMCSWVLRAVSSALPLIVATPRLSRELLKTALTLWATGEETVRARAFFVIRGLATSQRKLLPLAMKGSYLTYLRHTKTSNPTALPRINFFCACIAELFGLDMGLAYEQAFLSIRQLAVTLRNALTGKARAAGAQGGAASSAVCCWPFVNALRCWGQVLAQYPRESELGLLVYPYTQTCFGAIKLAATSSAAPMRLLLLRFLTHVAHSTDVFLPLAPFLLEVLEGAELRRASGRREGGGRGPAPKVPPLEHVLRVSKQLVHARAYQAKLVATVCELLLQAFGPLASAVAFPELALPVVAQLKAFAKETAVSQFRKAALGAAAHLGRNAAWAEERRDGAQLALMAAERTSGTTALRELEGPLVSSNAAAAAAQRGGAARRKKDQQAPLTLFLRQQEKVARAHASQAEEEEDQEEGDDAAEPSGGGDQADEEETTTEEEEEEERPVLMKKKTKAQRGEDKRKRTAAAAATAATDEPQEAGVLLDEEALLAMEDEVVDADVDDDAW